MFRASLLGGWFFVVILAKKSSICGIHYKDARSFALRNCIVQAQEGSPLPANEIERRVRELLDAANVPALRGVCVEVKDNCLILTGGVSTYYQKQLATELARRAFGVCQIVNHLHVPCNDGYE